MPPRRSKPGLTRMDAACDHLQLMGFPRAKIRRTVKRLLKVYLDAWPLLEEDSYRVVIEAMLEEQETEPEDPPIRDYPPHKEPTEHVEACESVDERHCIGETSTSLGNMVERNGGEICMLLAHDHSTRRRPPCYGWTSEDEDETMLALPTTTCKKQTMVLCSLSCHHDRKRKSRWDVKPDDRK